MKKLTHNIGSTIGTKKPRTNVDRSHFHITTQNTGEVIPIMCDLIYPGDKIDISVHSILRQTTLTVPVMDTTYIDIATFFVPLWQIWEDFFKFFGENEDPFDVKEKPTIPQLTSPTGGWKEQTLACYLKYPTNIDGYTTSALPTRAYAKIINDYYRDQNLQTACHINLTSTATQGTNGTDKVTDIECGGYPFIAGKYADYFTTALPKPQKGEPTLINLTGEAEIHAKEQKFNTDNDAPTNITTLDGNFEPGTYNLQMGVTSQSKKDGGLYINQTNNMAQSEKFGSFNNLYATIENQTNINELRKRFTEQQIKEIDEIYGTRYHEYLFGHWDVKIDMSKINKASFLGGTHEPIEIHQVPQTSNTTQGEHGTPLATLGALGQTKIDGQKTTKAFDQHGYLITMATIRYNHTYADGLEIENSYLTKEDFLDPLMNNLGNEPIYNQEIKMTNDPNKNKLIFGYKEYKQEAREKQNRVTGLMRPNATLSLGKIWTYADTYTDTPILSDEWIRENKDNVERTLAVENQPHFFAQYYFNYKIDRQIETYSIPGLKKL